MKVTLAVEAEIEIFLVADFDKGGPILRCFGFDHPTFYIRRTAEWTKSSGLLLLHAASLTALP